MIMFSGEEHPVNNAHERNDDVHQRNGSVTESVTDDGLSLGQTLGTGQQQELGVHNLDQLTALMTGVVIT